MWLQSLEIADRGYVLANGRVELQGSAADLSASPEIQDAYSAHKATDITMDIFLQQLLNALSLGGTYALLALGLAVVFSIIGLINFAHGELMTVSGYAICFALIWGLPFPLAVFAGLAMAIASALLMERIAFRPVRGASGTTLLLTSFGDQCYPAASCSRTSYLPARSRFPFLHRSQAL